MKLKSIVTKFLLYIAPVLAFAPSITYAKEPDIKVLMEKGKAAYEAIDEASRDAFTISFPKYPGNVTFGKIEHTASGLVCEFGVYDEVKLIVFGKDENNVPNDVGCDVVSQFSGTRTFYAFKPKGTQQEYFDYAKAAIIARFEGAVEDNQAPMDRLNNLFNIKYEWEVTKGTLAAAYTTPNGMHTSVWVKPKGDWMIKMRYTDYGGLGHAEFIWMNEWKQLEPENAIKDDANIKNMRK